MSSTPRLHSLLPTPRVVTVFLALVAGSACVDSGCPKGSHEVDGTCMDRELGDAGQMTHGAQGAGETDSGPGGGPVKTRDSGSGSSDLERDAGGIVADGGAPDTAADSSTNSETTEELPTCANTPCGAHADCDDSAGTPTCTCAQGYQGDGQTCTNVDECATSTDDCDAHALCIDEPGTFSCACKPGYEGDGQTCTANPCEPRVNPCDADTTTCRVAAGKASCDCNAGQDRCDGNKLACNTNTTSDEDNCGACSYVCAGDLACEDGSCEQAVVALSLGLAHSCAIDPRGKVLCWGSNANGELGRTTPTPVAYEPAEASIALAKHIDAGAARSCALTGSDDLVCWGSNYGGTLLPGDSRTSGVFAIAPGVSELREVSVGGAAICGRFENSVECWSTNLVGSLGTTSIANQVLSFAARNIVDVEHPTGVSVGFRMSCSIADQGAISCWGGGRASPEAIADAGSTPLTKATAVSVSLATAGGDTADSACALLESGRVMCWGHNDSGQLGNPNNTATDVTNALTVTDASSNPLEQAVQIGVGAHHACARRMDGSVVCWGERDRLGNGSSGSAAQRTFVPVQGIDDAVDLAVGSNHSCVRRANGQLQCWGANASGQLGVNPSTTSVALVPANVVGLP